MQSVSFHRKLQCFENIENFEQYQIAFKFYKVDMKTYIVTLPIHLHATILCGKDLQVII